MPDDDDTDRKADPRTGPGTTDDPNQANRTGLPRHSDERPNMPRKTGDPEDPKAGPGSTTDPNQADRT